jgi:RNA-binding protein 26
MRFILNPIYPGAVPPCRPSLPFGAIPAGPSASLYGNLGAAGAPLGPQNGSRKRSYNDRGDGDSQDRSFNAGGNSNGRSYKQPRRGGNVGRGNLDSFSNGRGGFQGRPPPMNLQGVPPQGFASMPRVPSPPSGHAPSGPKQSHGSNTCDASHGFSSTWYAELSAIILAPKQRTLRTYNTTEEAALSGLRLERFLCARKYMYV